jgi:hypothetical protein
MLAPPMPHTVAAGANVHPAHSCVHVCNSPVRAYSARTGFARAEPDCRFLVRTLLRAESVPAVPFRRSGCYQDCTSAAMARATAAARIGFTRAVTMMPSCPADRMSALPRGSEIVADIMVSAAKRATSTRSR